MNMNNDDSNKIANTLCRISLACLIVPFILSFVFKFAFFENAINQNDFLSKLIEFIFSVARIAGVVLVIYVRINYPKNGFGLLLQIIYIIVFVLFIVFGFVFAFMYASACESMMMGIFGCQFCY